MQRRAFRCNGERARAQRGRSAGAARAQRGRSAGAARRMLAIRPRPVVSVREHARITVGRSGAHR